jgi:hypothetical protein
VWLRAKSMGPDGDLEELVFDAARSMRPAARAELLTWLAARDPALRRRLDELLAMDAAANALLDRPPFGGRQEGSIG